MYDRRKNYLTVLSAANHVQPWGYAIADENGNEIDFPKRDVIGLLRYKERKGFLGILGGILGIDQTTHVGNIWLDNPRIGASPKSCWIIENYNPEKAEELSDLMASLGREYKVHIRMEPSPQGGTIASAYQH